GAGNTQRYLVKPSSTFIKYGKNLAAPRNYRVFSEPRILINRILSKNKLDAVFTDEIIINNTDVFNFLSINGNQLTLKTILAILNSQLGAFYLRTSNVNLSRQAFPKINVNNILSFPLPEITKETY